MAFKRKFKRKFKRSFKRKSYKRRGASAMRIGYRM